jgi:hypothetical protein
VLPDFVGCTAALSKLSRACAMEQPEIHFTVKRRQRRRVEELSRPRSRPRRDAELSRHPPVD